MKGRIEELKHQIKNVESLLDNLNGPLLQMALEEIRNLCFELDTLNRRNPVINKAHWPVDEHAEAIFEHQYQV